MRDASGPSHGTAEALYLGAAYVSPTLIMRSFLRNQDTKQIETFTWRRKTSAERVLQRRRYA